MRNLPIMYLYNDKRFCLLSHIEYTMGITHGVLPNTLVSRRYTSVLLKA